MIRLDFQIEILAVAAALAFGNGKSFRHFDFNDSRLLFLLEHSGISWTANHPWHIDKSVHHRHFAQQRINIRTTKIEAVIGSA